jgi:hypothetical protein
MASAGHTIVIDAPPDVVFGLYQRYDRHAAPA